MAKGKIIYGKDWLTDIKFPNLDKPFPVYYWDVWMVMTLQSELCDGNWEKLIDLIRQLKIKSYSNEKPYEEVRNQISFFKNRLENNNLKASDIFYKLQELYPEEKFIDRHIKYAESKLLSLNFKEKDKTKSMIFTPRVLKAEAALRGNFLSYWSENNGTKLDSQPLDYISFFEKKFKSSGYYNKHQSWKLEERLEKTLEKLTKKTSIFDLFVIYRAFLTVIIEKSDMIDDSFGVIGELAKKIFEHYISLDRSKLVMTSAGFYRDLLNLMIWEDYGYFDDTYQGFFSTLTPTEIATVEEVLLMEKEELEQEELDYAKNNALKFLGFLYSQHLMFDKFVPLAEELGTKNWMPIENLAKIAEKHQKNDLAKQVYEAALKDKASYHYNNLKKKYEELCERV